MHLFHKHCVCWLICKYMFTYETTQAIANPPLSVNTIRHIIHHLHVITSQTYSVLMNGRQTVMHSKSLLLNGQTTTSTTTIKHVWPNFSRTNFSYHYYLIIIQQFWVFVSHSKCELGLFRIESLLSRGCLLFPNWFYRKYTNLFQIKYLNFKLKLYILS